MSTENKNEFEKSGEQAETTLVGEFLDMLKHNKKFWLLPLIGGLLVIGAVIVLGGTAVAPFIYSLF